ncbi:MAG: hypothetical protein WAZ19_13010 [Anaerolineae bacterium]
MMASVAATGGTAEGVAAAGAGSTTAVGAAVPPHALTTLLSKITKTKTARRAAKRGWVNMDIPPAWV